MDNLLRKKYLLTYEDAQKIVSTYNNHQFWETQFMIDGYKVCTFNYFLCGYNDFMYPLGKDSKVTAFDMRGACFVFDKNNKLWNTFYMLPKFFNINQVEETQYDIVKDKNILNIGIKEDGSLIGFFKLPNNKIYSKTIGSFASEQAERALNILNSKPEWLKWINKLLDRNFTPLFEYVAFDNRIVLNYSGREIRFIGVRDNNNGNFYPSLLSKCVLENKYKVDLDILYKFPKDLKMIWSIQTTLNNLIELSKTEKGKEGWVILFEDDQLMKVKTEEYFRLHGLRTENIFREDFVIKNYLEEKIDDILTQLDPNLDKDAYDFVNNIINAVNNYYSKVEKELDNLEHIYNMEYLQDFKEFARNHYFDKYFNIFKTYIRTGDKKNAIYNDLLKRTNKLKKAKEFIKQYKI